MANCPACGSKDSKAFYRDRLGFKEVDPHRLQCVACGKVYWV